MSQFRGGENFFCNFFGKGRLIDFSKSERIFYLLFNEQVGNFNLLQGEYQSRNKAYTKICFLYLASQFAPKILRVDARGSPKRT